MVDLLYDIKLKIPLANDASPPSIHPVIVICPETTRLERPATPRFSDVTTQQKVYTLRPIQVQYVHFFASAVGSIDQYWKRERNTEILFA